MNDRINPRHLPLWIARLANEGYTINIEYSKKLVRITCEENALKKSDTFRTEQII